MPARLRDGSEAVFKINLPEAESEQEPDALAWWSGARAVRLLARDDERRALLLDQLADVLGLDRERMRGWGIAHALAWAYEGAAFLPEHVVAAHAIASVR